LAVPSLAGASFIVNPDHGARYGPITFNPSSIVIALKVGQSGTGSFRIHQDRYHGKFTGRITCLLPIGKPRLDIDRDVATVFVPKQLIAIDIGCSAGIRGGGNRVGVEPILISITL
jgi:hypothetical protein